MSKKVLMIFLDGVGVGAKNPSLNPFFQNDLYAIKDLLQGHIPYYGLGEVKGKNFLYRSINATLGVPGLPQSGTGQTSLLCGINAARKIGKHFGPHPYSTLLNYISEKNIFSSLQKIGKKVYYVNAYPPKYFEYIEQKRLKRTATTLAWTMSGNKLNDYLKLKNGKALSSDITGEKWNALGFPEIPELTYEDAGKRLVQFFKNFDFVFFEYFYTDHVGHSRSMNLAVNELKKVDSLISGVISKFDTDNMTLIITSDHGNIEDVSVKTHTRNPVPLIIYGEMCKYLNGQIKSITQIAPALIKYYKL